MKKTIYLTLAAASLLALTGCTGSLLPDFGWPDTLHRKQVIWLHPQGLAVAETREEVIEESGNEAIPVYPVPPRHYVPEARPAYHDFYAEHRVYHHPARHHARHMRRHHRKVHHRRHHAHMTHPAPARKEEAKPQTPPQQKTK